MARKRSRGIGTIYRRPGSPIYHCQYSTGKRRVRESTGTADEAAAREFLRKRQGMVAEGAAPPSGRVALADLPKYLARAYRNEGDPTELRARRYEARIAQYFAHLTEFFGSRAVKDIETAEIEDYVEHRRAEGAKSSTIRSEIHALARGLRLAIRRAPQLPTIRVKNARTGFFTGEDVAALLPHLPEYMRAFTEAAYITGWRRGELRGLEWGQVDRRRGVIRLDPNTTKNDEGREFPFAAHPRLAALLDEQRERTSELERRTGQLCPWVFWHGNGRQIAWFYDGWQTACEKAELAGRLFHDMRRSAVRNLIDAGVPQSVAMKITGHRTAAVFRRYEIRDGADTFAAVERLAAWSAEGERSTGKVIPLRRARSL